MPLQTHTKLLQVPVLIGAPEALVCMRQKRNVYETNREIKVWAAWFVLKALTTSGYLKNWLRQSPHLQQVLECTEGTLRSHIASMRRMELITVDAARNIKLCSYERAASILQINYEGTENIAYQWGCDGRTQPFAYSLRVKEIENAKMRQLEGLLWHVNNNPELMQVLQDAMRQQGYDVETVTGEAFQQWLLKMQQRSFAEGSAIYDQLHARRADINRSVNGIQECHKYKCKTSVSYLKKILKKYNLVTITKSIVESKQRSRRYIIDGNKKVDAYKYNRSRKSTLLVSCDDISPIILQAA